MRAFLVSPGPTKASKLFDTVDTQYSETDWPFIPWCSIYGVNHQSCCGRTAYLSAGHAKHPVADRQYNFANSANCPTYCKGKDLYSKVDHSNP